MARTLTLEQQQRAQQLAQLIGADAAPIVQDIAELLATVPDEQLFGDTEFLLRDRVLKLIGCALNARLGQKKTATPAPASTARAAGKPPPSTATAPATPSASAAPSAANAPTTTAAGAAGTAPGTSRSA